MDNNNIIITNARVHNLKNVSIKIPKNTLTVITGLSGSGKSSLAFDTIYVEGQRRYIESLSSYARQFLGQYQPPDVESITGLSPAIAIDQKTSSNNPRSTVGTITEINNYLRVLFARTGTLYCPKSGEEVKKYSISQISKELLKLPLKTNVVLLAPLKFNSPVELSNKIATLFSMGQHRFRINGKITLIQSENDIPKNFTSLEVVTARTVIKDNSNKNIPGLIEFSLEVGEGKLIALINEKKEKFFSEFNMSPLSGIEYPDLEPQIFSFNSPLGACSECNGLGESKTFDRDLMLFDANLSILDGAITPLAKKNSFFYKMTIDVAKQEDIDLSLPFNDLPKSFVKILFNGTEKIYKYSFDSDNSHFEFSKPYSGIMYWLTKKFHETSSERVRADLEKYMNIQVCPRCQGKRLNEIALSTKINSNSIVDICSYSIKEAYAYFQNLELKGEKSKIAEKLIKEISNRLKFLLNVGLEYLTLDRSAISLSGGESQRIRLATQIGSALSGVLYVLDEPSIGLHQRDNDKLIKTLQSLKKLGNTVLVVEHDESTISCADYIIDMGPGAGLHGGEIVAHGPLEKILKCKQSLTAKFLTNRDLIPVPQSRRTSDSFIKLNSATQNNIRNLDVHFPLNCLTCVTGVSGSGKSTLIHGILVPAVKNYLSRKSKFLHQNANYDSITGVHVIKKVIELDQSPIGRTPHSNPATYTNLFDDIRSLFSKVPTSQSRGYKPGRFSFNIKGGRCEECEGNGVKKIEMHFLPDVYITCSECKGTRFNNETLAILYKGINISSVLDMSIEEALDFFKNHKRLNRILSTLNSVGLGYMKLGQPATTLSGGEAQRVKLSRELAKRTTGHCLYVLDEPTTGLHFQDVKMLLAALQNLIDQGNTVIVIEHNLDIIKSADYIIDLGPEGGDLGGNIVVSGTPEKVVTIGKSYTGKYLRKFITNDRN